MSDKWDVLWNELTNYKDSMLLMAAVELRIFDCLKEAKKVEELANLLEVKREPLIVFLESLTAFGYLVKEGDYYKNTFSTNTYLVSTSPQFIGPVIDMERYIYEHFLTPSRLIKSLRYRDTMIEDKISNPVFQEAYDKVIYNRAVNLKIAHILQRVLKGIEAPSIAEIGRSPGRVIKFIQILYPTAILTHIPNWQKFCERQISEKFDAIVIQNTVHYIKHNKLTQWLFKLNELVKDEGYILIHDFFTDHLEMAGLWKMKQRLLLDWLTHGGIETLRSEDLLNVANSIGFYKVKVQNEKTLGSLLLLKKG